MMLTRLLAAGVIALAAQLPVAPTEAPLPQDAALAAEPFAVLPPAPYGEAGPADSLYRLGREAINRGDYRRAAELFAEITARYPRSEYAPDAPYWRAFALYRSGREDDLRQALESLEYQKATFPRATTAGDGRELTMRIRGALARRGDAQAAEAVTRAASQQGSCGTSRDTEVRTAAMNALLQMDADGALPIIKQVLQRRDACAEPLREKAVFLLSQLRSSERESLLIDVSRNDPSRKVREQAVFWMGQVPTEKAAAALEEIATSSPDNDMRSKAVFALQQQQSPRGMALLRRLAESGDTPEEVREQAIFGLGQVASQENAEHLRALFGRLGSGGQNEELRKKVLFSLSQMRGYGNDKWLLGVAMDADNSSEIRGHALWTAGQNGVAGSDLAALYSRVTDPEVKEKLIWVLSQSGDRAATDKLLDIARNDPDTEMRKKALFWLGQNDDPRVRQLITEILNKP